jgi:hypothetical protein
MPAPLTDGHGRSTGLVDVLDRVLDKGVVVAGDIKVSLAEVELLTIRIRLLICSIDRPSRSVLTGGSSIIICRRGGRLCRLRTKSSRSRCERSNSGLRH